MPGFLAECLPPESRPFVEAAVRLRAQGLEVIEFVVIDATRVGPLTPEQRDWVARLLRSPVGPRARVVAGPRTPIGGRQRVRRSFTLLEVGAAGDLQVRAFPEPGFTETIDRALLPAGIRVDDVELLRDDLAAPTNRR